MTSEMLAMGETYHLWDDSDIGAQSIQIHAVGREAIIIHFALGVDTPKERQGQCRLSGPGTANCAKSIQRARQRN